MTPETLNTIFAGVTLMIYYTFTTVVAVVFLWKKLDQTRDTILADVNKKHEQNDARWNATNALVIRHDTMLNPEFNGNFGGKHHAR